MQKFIFSSSALCKNNLCMIRFWCAVIFIRYGVSILHSSSVESFADNLRAVNIPMPVISAYLCKGSEFFGGILLFSGLLIRPVCIILIIDMFVATFIFHHAEVLNNGLTTFLLLICLASISLAKADAFTIDHLIGRKLKSNE